MTPRNLRDEVALVVLPVLIAQAGAAACRLSRTRKALIRDALAWGFEYAIQRAIDPVEMMQDESGLALAVPTRGCVGGLRCHRWVGAWCVRCGAPNPNPGRLERRHAQQQKGKDGSGSLCIKQNRYALGSRAIMRNAKAG